MRDYRADRTDKLFSISVAIVILFLLTAILQVGLKTKGAGFGLLEGIIVLLIVIGWAIIRKTRLKFYASLINVFMFTAIVVL